MSLLVGGSKVVQKSYVGKKFAECPLLTPRFVLLTQYQESYDTEHSIYLETLLNAYAMLW